MDKILNINDIQNVQANFIKSIFGGMRGNTPEIFTVSYKDKNTKQFDSNAFDINDMESILNRIKELTPNNDVYFGVCLQNNFPEQGKRGTADNVKIMPGVWFDLDIAGIGHKNTKLPNEIDGIRFVDELPLKPTIIVNSGGGLHLYYLFKAPWVFQNADELKQAKELSRRIQNCIIKLGYKHGWKLDNTSDLARVLRVPGTLNFKAGTFTEVKIMKHDDNQRYEINQIQEFIGSHENSETILTPINTVSADRRELAVSRDFIKADIQLIEEKCLWMRHCKEDVQSLPEPEWFAMLSILGKCKNGDRLSHEWSSPYPGYSNAETAMKLSETMKAGPRTCKYIRDSLNAEEYCSQCEHWDRIKSPYSLGIPTRKSSSVDSYPFTDMGNAQRLIYQHGQDLRFCYSLKKWLIWDGKMWNINKDNEIVRKAKDTVRRMMSENNHSSSNDFRSHALKSQNANNISRMIRMAESEEEISIGLYKLDTNLYLLNCENGTLDLTTGKLRPHNRDDFITNMIPVSYDKNAKCPQFTAFLEKIFNNNQDLINYVKRIIGYSLTGETKEQCIFILYGTGANGKSTLLEIIRTIMGDYAKQTSSDTFTCYKNEKIRNDLARLRGARFVTAVEIGAGKKLDEELIKQITGGDPISARFLYGELFEYYPRFKLFWAVNHKPKLTSVDKGISRRLRMIPFSVTIKDEEQDLNLLSKLKTELPGILSWAVEGCLEWQSMGLSFCQDVNTTTEEYIHSQDAIENFIEERCIVDKTETVSIAHLYNAFEQWRTENNEQVLTKNELGSILRQKGFTQERKSSVRYWIGIGIKVPIEPEEEVFDSNIN